MLSFTETIALQLSKAGITPRIRFDTVQTAESSDDSKRPCRRYHLRFGGNKRKGIQALYTDGTYRSVVDPPPAQPKGKMNKRFKKTKKAETFMTYEVFDASFVMIGQYGRRGWGMDELIFTDRDWVDVEGLVPVLRGLYNRRAPTAKLEATIAVMYETAAMRQKLHDEGRIPDA